MTDVEACFARLDEIYLQQMAITLDPDETTRRHEEQRYALAVELTDKGYSVEGYYP